MKRQCAEVLLCLSFLAGCGRARLGSLDGPAPPFNRTVACEVGAQASTRVRFEEQIIETGNTKGPQTGIGIEVGSIDGDERPDLIVFFSASNFHVGAPRHVYVIESSEGRNGLESRELEIETGKSGVPQLVDANADGYQDIVNSGVTWYADQKGGFLEADSPTNQSGRTLWGHLDNDGRPDWMFVEPSGFTVRYSTADGLGDPEPFVEDGTLFDNLWELYLLDVTGDGLDDLVKLLGEIGDLEVVSHGLSLRTNLGDARFGAERVLVPLGGLLADGWAFADLDCDGQSDLVSVTPDLQLEVRAAPNFAVVQSVDLAPPGFVDPGAQSLAIGDFNGDGALDVVLGQTVISAQLELLPRVVVLLGLGGGTLSTTPLKLSSDEDGFAPQVAAAGDVDGDGLDDIVIANVEKPEVVHVWFGAAD